VVITEGTSRGTTESRVRDSTKTLNSGEGTTIQERNAGKKSALMVMLIFKTRQKKTKMHGWQIVKTHETFIPIEVGKKKNTRISSCRPQKQGKRPNVPDPLEKYMNKKKM